MKKFLSILLLSVLIFTGCSFNFSLGGEDDTAPDTTADDTAADDSTTDATALTQTFNTANFGYTFNYPADWQKQEDVNSYTVLVANGKASVAIQNLASTAMGGVYANVNDVITEFKTQLNEAQNVKLSDESDLPYTLEDGTILTGKQFMVEYTIPEDNATYKQWQIVVPRKDGQIFHAWSYTSLVENYDEWLPLAQEIWASRKMI
ncbi:MAG: hypothetical protein WC269_02880 [Candidatus Gracilibacteria bacterium]|jgi:hypothetical protein